MLIKMATKTTNTTKNSNLFYQLYSTPQQIANSGFVCNSAIDESDTSADISNDQLQITDSNGDILAALDLTGIHSDGIQEYYSETKILGPQSAYLLQGNVLGETYAAQHFLVPFEIQKFTGYESFINVSFDVHYISCGEMKAIHLNTYKLRTEPGNVCDLIQSKFDTLKIPATVTIKKELLGNCVNAEKCCPECATEADFLVFQSSEEGWAFFVHTVMVSIIDVEYMNENGEWVDYSESPFLGANIDFDYIIDLLKLKKPRYIGEDKLPTYDSVPCDIYKFIISIAPMAIDDNQSFRENMRQLIEFSQYFNTDGTMMDDMETKFVFTAHMYPDVYAYYWGNQYSILQKYNIHDIIEVLGEIAEYIAKTNVSARPHEMAEDIEKRIYNQKYFNGAFRGIGIVPDWPEDASEQSVLMLANVPDYIIRGEKIDLPENMHIEGFKCNTCVDLFIKVRSMVKINTLSQSEYEIYRKDHCNLPVRKVTSNEQLATCVDGIWSSELHAPISNDDMWTTNPSYSDGEDIWSDSHKPTHNEHHRHNHNEVEVIDEFDRSNYEFLEHVPFKKEVEWKKREEQAVGLYGFMAWLNENDLWMKVGDAYMVIGKKDDYQSKLKNL